MAARRGRLFGLLKIAAVGRPLPRSGVLGFPYSHPRGGRAGRWQAAIAAATAAGAAACAGATEARPSCDEGKDGMGSCKLRDGRTLAYRIHGSGPVTVFAFHGMGSSRMTWEPKGQSLSDLCPGVRLVALDRPGYGDSTDPPAGYSYRDFAKDVAELADGLGVQRFCVAGHSSGGPYALACAAVLTDRVQACAAVSSDAPYAHPQAKPELRLSDDFALGCTENSAGCYGRDPKELFSKWRDNDLKSGKAAKLHAWKQGVIGFVTDFTLERIPWSFALEDIVLGPKLMIWAGGEDYPAISLGSPFMQSVVPGSQLRIVPGGNHGFKSDPVHYASILQELKKQAS